MKQWANSLPRNRARTITALLGFTTVCGTALFISFVRAPSESGQQFLFGLSLMRLIIAGIFVTLLAANLWAVFLFSGKRGDDAELKLRALISKRFTLTFGCLHLLAFITGMAMLLMIPPVPVSLRILEPVRSRLLDPLVWSFVSSAGFSVLLRRMYREQSHEEFLRKLDRVWMIAGIFLFTFFFYEHFAAWIGWVNKTKYSYWNLLAGEFLQGRLYLHNPPANTHDLTQYNGRWYVPSPPMPAVLMMPLAYLVGAENISTADFSMLFGAMNAAILFLILEELVFRQWIKTSRASNFLLVLLFAFGTPHLWVSINGRFWFVSQIVTVTFLALAILGALKAWSPWLIGLCIGLAVGTRPNGLMSLPVAFAIAMQILKENGETLDFKKMFAWAFKSAIPIGLIVLGLLRYNHARFEDYLDFGYVTIDGNPVIVSNAQTYGLFSLRYVPYNLRVMFLYLPDIIPGGKWPILPSGAGMSIFLTTPALVYLFRRYGNKWWVWGAWTTVLFNFLLLVSYHNTGMDQFGYRYILDVIVPLTALLASALGGKIPWHFVLTVLLSILINMYGANWFMNG